MVASQLLSFWQPEGHAPLEPLHKTPQLPLLPCGALFSAFQRFDYDFVFTILATIVAIIVAGEMLVNTVRKAMDV